MRKYLLLVSLLALPAAGFAADSVSLTVSGNLYQPTACDVNATSMTIAFGDILSSSIDGAKNKKPLNVTVTCTNLNPIQSVNVQVTGTGTTTNKLPITGTAKGFQLALKKGTTDQNFGANIKVSSNGSLDLSLTPVIKTGEKFVTGAFSASLTIKVIVT
ncbi:fimbrial protein [Huaxiibacter chinensis]